MSDGHALLQEARPQRVTTWCRSHGYPCVYAENSSRRTCLATATRQSMAKMFRADVTRAPQIWMEQCIQQGMTHVKTASVYIPTEAALQGGGARPCAPWSNKRSVSYKYLLVELSSSGACRSLVSGWWDKMHLFGRTLVDGGIRLGRALVGGLIGVRAPHQKGVGNPPQPSPPLLDVLVLGDGVGPLSLPSIGHGGLWVYGMALGRCGQKADGARRDPRSHDTCIVMSRRQLDEEVRLRWLTRPLCDARLWTVAKLGCTCVV